MFVWTLLANGKVLITGGLDSFAIGGHAGAGAELFDPTTGGFTTTGNMKSARADHTATLLASGEVLVVGGWNGNAPDAPDDPPFDPLFAETFDATPGSFTATRDMNSTRSGHTATLLPNGKVAVIGGFAVPQDAAASVELYDPASRTFSASGQEAEPRSDHTATLLTNGKVLIAGGRDPYLNVISNGIPVIGTLLSVELYDPAAGSSTPTGGLVYPRQGHTATRLNDGRVLITGGTDGKGMALATAELYK